MRFFVSQNIKRSKPIRYAIAFFMFFVLSFWVMNFVYFGVKFGYSLKGIEEYYFGSPEFEELISLSQVLENSHVNIFTVGILFLCLSAIVFYSSVSERWKIFLIVFFFFSFLFYGISDIVIYLLGRGSAMIKLFSFLLFQLSIIVAILLAIFFKNTGNRSGRFYAIVVFLFSVLNFLFVGSLFPLFISKIGLSIEDIAGYYLGDPIRFIKPKSFAWLVEISQIHFIPMAIYIVAISHFFYFTNFKLKRALTILLFALAFVDNISGFAIAFLGKSFAYVKLFSFLLLALGLFMSSVLLIREIFRLGFYLKVNQDGK